jgi:hypothetical protein
MDKGVTPTFLADHIFNELLDLDIDYLIAVAGSQGPLWEAAATVNSLCRSSSCSCHACRRSFRLISRYL